MVRAARWLFGIAGCYGLLATLGLYSRPLDAQALWPWAFAGAAAATQLLYLLIAFDPRRFRPAIPVGIASKLSFALPVLWLFAHGAAGRGTLAAAVIDLVLAAAFLAMFVALGQRSGRTTDPPA